MEVQVASEIDAFTKQMLVCFAKDAKQFMVPASNYLPSGRKVACSGKERCLTKLRGSALDLAAQSSILKPPLTPSSAETAKNCALARRWNSLEEREEDDGGHGTAGGVAGIWGEEVNDLALLHRSSILLYC